MFTIGTIVLPLDTADSEYSVCGNSVLRKAKVIETCTRKDNGNNIKIEILEHFDPEKVGKHYWVDDRYFKAEIPEWIWVDAFKATDENNCCLGYRYNIYGNNVYKDKVALGSKGFHVCTELRHCFKNYPYDFRNKFYAVRALVRAHDYQYLNPNNTVLVAKEIEFVYDMTDDGETIGEYRDYLNG